MLCKMSSTKPRQEIKYVTSSKLTGSHNVTETYILPFPCLPLSFFVVCTYVPFNSSRIKGCVEGQRPCTLDCNRVDSLCVMDLNFGSSIHIFWIVLLTYGVHTYIHECPAFLLADCNNTGSQRSHARLMRTSAPLPVPTDGRSEDNMCMLALTIDYTAPQGTPTCKE